MDEQGKWSDDQKEIRKESKAGKARLTDQNCSGTQDSDTFIREAVPEYQVLPFFFIHPSLSFVAFQRASCALLQFLVFNPKNYHRALDSGLLRRTIKLITA